MPPAEPIIRVTNLHFSYGGVPVLENVSFSVPAGDYIGVIGPNAGGKTTLVKILVGLLEGYSGTVEIFGTPLPSFKQQSLVGYVPQRIAQTGGNFPITVYEVVASGRLATKTRLEFLTTADKQAIDHALQQTQIADLRLRQLRELSGGQRQRVYIARALVNQPKLLILDEPFVGVDVAAQHDFYAFLKTLNQDNGITILFVSHDVDIIASEVKSILCLNRGLLCYGGPHLLHEPGMLEHLYGRAVTHIHKADL